MNYQIWKQRTNAFDYVPASIYAFVNRIALAAYRAGVKHSRSKK